MRTDVHQHLWTEPLIEALAGRAELPFIRRERGLTVLHLACERPYVIDRTGEEPALRAALVSQDGLDRALLCLSSPLGIERLPREEAVVLLEAYHEGALSLGEPFGVWGAIALHRPDPDDVGRALDRGCVGISVPAGALGGVEELALLGPVLSRLQERGAPLLVHPGPGCTGRLDSGFRECPSLAEPLWWPALTGYVAAMQAAWLAFQVTGRSEHPRLRVIFSMLAGLAPLHSERLHARGGPSGAPDPLSFYETSSYGPVAVRATEAAVGAEQILYGSDRPVVEPGESLLGLDWDLLSERTTRALGAPTMAVAV